MTYQAKILADSVSPAGHRLTTQEVTMPRIVLAEFNTHRVLSRNSASSRAIPVEKQLKNVLEEPFVPDYWGINQKGMQAEQKLDRRESAEATGEWLCRRDLALLGAVALIGGVKSIQDEALKKRIGALQALHGEVDKPLGRPVHKQLANRLLEPFMWHTVIVTATEWDNFYALRANSQAQPEIRQTAEAMRQAYLQSEPAEVDYGQWHLPLIQSDERHLAVSSLVKISAGRCARVSYLTHAGQRDPQEDIALYERLTASGHMSPLEHVARPLLPEEMRRSVWSGNFRGWHQHRKDIPNEDNFARGDNFER